MHKIKLLTLAALGLLLLGSCEFSFDISLFSSNATSATSTVSTTSTTSSTSATSSEGFYRPSSYSITQQQYNFSSGSFTLGASGNRKLLVIPVSFSDARCGTAVCASRRADIEDTFFGETSDTSWESVASYYYKSSYGALNLTGIVTPFYESSYTMDAFASLTRTTGDYYEYFDPTWQIVEDAVAWYKTYSGSNLTDYDTDGDGLIDAVWLIYNNPNALNEVYSDAGEDVFWAYTYWDYSQYYVGTMSNPAPMTYAWASYDFMYEGYGSLGLDAHTYIHETGHVLGLDDYYSYTDGDWGAAGAVDMMDYNIVDHNAFSKFLLGWADPYVIDGTAATTEITLDPFESSGDFILINDDWNGSAYDEYLILEFYTPTGLNYKDSLTGGYPGNGLRSFTEPGIKIYHVDGRLGAYNGESGNFIGYTDTLDLSATQYAFIAHSNTVDYSENANFRLLHLLEEGGVNTFKDAGAYATNATLFQQGDSFNPTDYSAFFFQAGGRFNDNSSIGYSIAITSMSSSQATVTITKI